MELVIRNKLLDALSQAITLMRVHQELAQEKLKTEQLTHSALAEAVELMKAARNDLNKT